MRRRISTGSVAPCRGAQLRPSRSSASAPRRVVSGNRPDLLRGPPARRSTGRQRADLPWPRAGAQGLASGSLGPESLDLGPEAYRAVTRRQARRETASGTESCRRARPAGRRRGSRPAPAVVERREDLAPAGVDHGQAIAAGGLGRGGDPGDERARGRAPRPAGAIATLGERPRRRDPDPQAGERARADPDGDQVDRLPAAGRRSTTSSIAPSRTRAVRPAGRPRRAE